MEFCFRFSQKHWIYSIMFVFLIVNGHLSWSYKLQVETLKKTCTFVVKRVLGHNFLNNSYSFIYLGDCTEFCCCTGVLQAAWGTYSLLRWSGFLLFSALLAEQGILGSMDFSICHEWAQESAISGLCGTDLIEGVTGFAIKILQDQGLNQCFLCWQVNSLRLSHQESSWVQNINKNKINIQKNFRTVASLYDCICVLYWYFKNTMEPTIFFIHCDFKSCSFENSLNCL